MATEVPIKSNLCLEHPPKSERDPGELVVAVVGGMAVVVGSEVAGDVLRAGVGSEVAGDVLGAGVGSEVAGDALGAGVGMPVQPSPSSK